MYYRNRKRSIFILLLKQSNWELSPRLSGRLLQKKKEIWNEYLIMKKQDYILKYNDSTPLVVKLRHCPLNSNCPDYELTFINIEFCFPF